MPIRSLIAIVVVVMFSRALCAQTQPASQPAPPPAKTVLITETKGFEHDVVKRKDGKPSRVEQIIAMLADKTKLMDVEATRDASILTPEKLKQTRLVIFHTTGDLPMKPEDLEQWIKDGGAFLALHCASDTFHGNLAYLRIVNGEFEAHPWTQDAIVTLKVDDANHPAMKGFPEHFTHQEEIYQQKNFDPKSVHLLMSLDMQATALKRPQHIPIAWCKEYGKGKVFYTSLGHRDDMWTDPVYQAHLVGAIKWLLNIEKADATPNPQVSAEEDKLAKEAAAGPAAETLPKVPDGFAIKAFVRAPEIHSPAGMCVTPDGKVFVGEDDYNTGLGIEEGICRVKLCVDTDRDGKGDKVTVFADKLNAPQGMTYVGGTLYVVHAPYLSAFRDTNGDGVADERVDLITGLGPKPEGLVHHIPSGVRMGIDGWLYIAIGDKGIKEATGKDGRKITLHGGGVVRIRPDGTELQVFASGLRNIFAVSLDPYMNAFTRDNTNDGGGWNSRLSQIQRDAQYGYPSLFKNFSEEIIPCIEDFGGGGATGSMYVQEPGWPGTYGDSLYTMDWGKGALYRHELKPRGATFAAPQEEFSKPGMPTAIDMDGVGRMYVADWHRHSWGATGPEGIVYTISAGAGLASFPDMSKASVKQLLNYVASTSQVRRREAQWELLKRGAGPEAMSGLKEIAESATRPMPARVAAVFTLVQLDWDLARPLIMAMAQEPEMREFAIRPLADRDSSLNGVEPKFFTAALTDASPRVRAQAAIAIGHLNKPELAKQLVPLTADDDIMVRHGAMQSIRRLNNADPCIAALDAWHKPEVVAGALRTLRRMHEKKVVDAVGNYLANESQPKMRQEAIKALTPLYKQDAPWDGSWWMTRPDTDGPYFKSAPWAQTPAVAQLMIKAMSDPDLPTAQFALAQIGLAKVDEAAPALAKMAAAEGPMRVEAAKSLIAMKSATPEALKSMETMVLTDAFDAELRGNAAAALGATEGAEVRGVLIHLLAALDANPKVTDALLDKCADALASKPAAADEVARIEPLLKGAHRSTRVAASTTLLRSDATPAKELVAKVWKEGDAEQLDVQLTAAAKLPAEPLKAQVEPIRALLSDKRENIRHAAITAIGHIRDEAAIDDLLASFNKDADRITAATALTHISPGKVNDKQILLVTKVLVQSCVASVRGKERDSYGRLMNAAEKFLADSRLPKDQVASLQAQLRQPGIIDQYQRTDAIVAPDGQAWTAVFPPEEKPGGPFGPFVVKDKTYAWVAQPVSDPRGMQRLEMPGNSVLYLTANYESPAPAGGGAGTALLTLGSDDGIKVWLNGKSVHTSQPDRALKADMDKVALTLGAGTNVLLFRVNNTSDGSGIQARIRTRVPEFEVDDLPEVVAKIPGTADRGRALFTSDKVNCIKCHAIDPKDEPKGPFLGDAGSKFDVKYLTESITRPGAKIAQGFATEKVVAKNESGGGGGGGGGETEYVGFVAKEGAEDVQLRDANGKVVTIAKHNIVRRVTLAGSIMPDGLTDTMPLDDFGSLVTFLQSLKGATTQPAAPANPAPTTTAAAAAK